MSSVGRCFLYLRDVQMFWVCSSLIKDQKQRPKYAKLKSLAFIKKYETKHVDVGEWAVKALKEADAVAGTTAPRYVAWLVSFFYFFFSL